MTRPRPGSAAGARKYPPLGILLATDHGLVECIPGARAERGIDGPRFTSVDARGEIAAAAAPGEGVWVHIAKVEHHPDNAVLLVEDFG